MQSALSSKLDTGSRATVDEARVNNDIAPSMLAHGVFNGVAQIVGTIAAA